MDPASAPGHDHRLVMPVRAGTASGPTKGQVKGAAWRRSSHGLYVPSEMAADGLQRTLEAGVLMPRYGAVTGWAALGWLGGRWCEGLEADGVTLRPVPVALSRRTIRPQPGMLVCGERYDPRECELVDGIRITSAVRSVCFEMRYARSLADAVAVLDMAAADDLVEVAEVVDWMGAHPSYTGIEQGRTAAALGNENAWSPMEARTRMVWVNDAGLPVPLTNRALFDHAGRHLRTPDLFDPVAGVGAEYDGWIHERDLRQRRTDRDRLDLYADHHIQCVVVMAGDLADRVALARRLHAAYARAALAPAERSWTLAGPPSWVDASSVAKRRALDAGERAVWLSYRRLA